MHLPIDDTRFRIFIVVEVVRVAATVGYGQPRGLPAAGSSDPLRIVEWLRWHIAQEYRLQIAQVYANLKRGRGAEQMRPSVLEPMLSLPRLVAVDLRGMFLCAQRWRQVGLFVEEPVVVFREALMVRWSQVTGTTIPRTDAANVMAGHGCAGIAFPHLVGPGGLDPQPARVESKRSVGRSRGEQTVRIIMPPVTVP